MTDITNYPIWATGAQHNFVQRPTSLSLQICFVITFLDYWIHGQFLSKFKPGYSNSSQRSAVLESMNFIFLQWRSMMMAKIGTSFDHKSLVFIKAMKRWNIFWWSDAKNILFRRCFPIFKCVCCFETIWWIGWYLMQQWRHWELMFAFFWNWCPLHSC